METQVWPDPGLETSAFVAEKCNASFSRLTAQKQIVAVQFFICSVQLPPDMGLGCMFCNILAFGVRHFDLWCNKLQRNIFTIDRKTNRCIMIFLNTGLAKHGSVNR